MLWVSMRHQSMPKGIHSSVRVALAVPPKLHEQLSEWAEYEGRPIASLCLYLVEQGLRQAQREGIAPSHISEETGRLPGKKGEESKDKRLIKALLQAMEE